MGEQVLDEQGVVARKAPSSACRSAGSLRRSLPLASSASAAGSLFPWHSSSSIARPEAPSTLVATEAN